MYLPKAEAGIEVLHTPGRSQNRTSTYSTFVLGKFEDVSMPFPSQNAFTVSGGRRYGADIARQSTLLKRRTNEPRLAVP